MANYVVLYRCGHQGYYNQAPPKIADDVYCRRCGEYTRVKATNDEWSWHCPVCKITRPHGTDTDGARRSGRTHQRKYHHVTVLRQGYETREVLGPEDEGLSVADERIEWVKATNHQGALKALVNRVTVQRGQSTMDR